MRRCHFPLRLKIMVALLLVVTAVVARHHLHDGEVVPRRQAASYMNDSSRSIAVELRGGVPHRSSTATERSRARALGSCAATDLPDDERRAPARRALRRFPAG